jgi:two-component system, response regulator / RNA-binding antiterminator
MVAIQTEQLISEQKRSVLLVGMDNKHNQHVQKEGEQLTSFVLKQTLLNLSYDVTDFEGEVMILPQVCTQHCPDLLIINTHIPSPSLLKALTSINKISPLPILLFAEKETPLLIQSSIKAGVSAYIVNDTHPERLKSLINVACERFNQHQVLLKELQQTKNQLADRKIVERAKGYLMEQKSISEHEAFTTLRNMAMNNGQTLVQVSHNIISVFAPH